MFLIKLYVLSLYDGVNRYNRMNTHNLIKDYHIKTKIVNYMFVFTFGVM